MARSRAALLSLLDEDWHRVLRYGLSVTDDSPLSEVVDAMESHLRKQRSVLVDRRAFYARVQEEGENFDDRVMRAPRPNPAGVPRVQLACAAPWRAMCAPRPNLAGAAGARCCRCGRAAHADPAACRATSATCNSCGQRGHFAVVCVQVARESTVAPVEHAAPEPHIGRLIRDVYVNGVSTRPTPPVSVRLSTAAGVFTMAARADSGAEATVIGEDSLSSICVEPAQLEPCIGQPFSAVGRHPLTCIGSFQAALELGDRSTTAAVFVIKEMTGLLLSWFDCVALGILPRDFPAQIRSVEDTPRPTDDATHSGDVTPSDDVTPSALPAAAGSARCASDRPTPCETPRDRLCPATGAETGGPAPPADGPSPAAGLGGPLPAWNSDSDPPEALAPLIDSALERVRAAAERDPEHRALSEVILAGFPENRHEAPPAVRAYWGVRHQLAIDDGLVVYGARLVVPSALRRGVLEKLHESHQGVDRTKRRARLSVYWPGIDKQIADTVAACAQCRQRLPSHAREPMWREDGAPTRVFESVSADYFSAGGHTYLVYVDRLSGWPCYNKSTRRLSPLKIGSRVDLQDPATGRWNRIGVIVGVGQRRTYLVKTASGRVLWRNRRYLRPYRPLLTEPTPPVAPSAPRPPAAGAPQPPPPPPLPERTAVAAERAVRPAAGAPVVCRSPPVWSPEVETAAAAALPRRSQRQRRGPGRLQVRWGATSYEE
ncbi:uncharacterized protein FJT64_004040 [Amphibalanus amphitrite]|uniref:RNA-directed DNA polymerase n=1 Tax=Amphibalanus amphitrite TaxID=1232801 RepID=A0A6A4W938_AMPAM|nr:uncharacterized protein FJT64_004040 [Amphibalanus amphitrite]